MLIFTINSHHDEFSQHEDQAADKGRQFISDSPSAQHAGRELRWPVFKKRHRVFRQRLQGHEEGSQKRTMPLHS